MLGIPKDSVILCPYSEDWRLYFEKEKTTKLVQLSSSSNILNT
jgi:hypothetical protein